MWRDFLINVTSTFAADALYWGAGMVSRAHLPGGRLLHRRELWSRLREMPFIYRDLEAGDVLSDYVDVEIATVDLDRMKVRELAGFDPGTVKRIHDRKKVLILGNAGIGKTTFVRYTILSLLQDRRSLTFLPDQKFLSFYVPLKALDFSRPFPILSYLLERHAYLSGRNGLTRLIKAAERAELFLFLDGYDEIYFDTGHRKTARSGVHIELEMLLGGARFQETSIRRPDEYQRFFDAMKYCRVWLTSRREFFLQHPLNIFGSGSDRGAYDFVAVGIFGIGNHRLTLVKRIFDRYRNRHASYRALLNEELFLTAIDRAPDRQMCELSYSPLFLTVMCYIYAQRAVTSGSPDVDWFAASSELVVSCVKLLLRDLDEYKARGFAPAERLALIGRRNAYLEEKETFLGYVAYRTLLDAKSVFAESYLQDLAEEYFRSQAQSPNRDSILRGVLEQTSDSLVKQLLNQGVFVVIDKGGNDVLYDFPHRRFREELAARHIDKNWTTDSVLQNLGRPDFAEFVIVFVRLSDRRDAVIRQLLVEAVKDGQIEYFGRLASSCLTNLPEEIDVGPQLERFFLDVIENRRSFAFTEEVFSRLQPSAVFVEYVKTRFRAALAAEDAAIVELCGFLLMQYSAADLAMELPPTLVLAKHDSLLLQALVKIAADVRPEVVAALAASVEVDSNEMRIIAGAVARAGRSDEAAARLLVALCEKTNIFQQALLFAALLKYRQSLFADLFRSPTLPQESFKVAAIVRSALLRPAEWHEALRAGATAYVVSQSVEREIMRHAEAWTYGPSLEFGRVYWSMEQFLRGLRKLRWAQEVASRAALSHEILQLIGAAMSEVGAVPITDLSFIRTAPAQIGG